MDGKDARISNDGSSSLAVNTTYDPEAMVQSKHQHLPRRTSWDDGTKSGDEDGHEGTTTRRASFFRKVSSHMDRKSHKDRNHSQTSKTSKTGEPTGSDVVRINNNISLQMSHHTSRHSTYHDGDEDSDMDDVDSFCDESAEAKSQEMMDH
jgi:hypothetical protein